MQIFGRAVKKSPSSSLQSVQFLMDQDGPMERTIKAKLCEFFHDVLQLEEAYFVRVSYPGGVQGVALCVYGTPELDHEMVLKGVSNVYGRIVQHAPQGLHTIFLTPAQKIDIAKVCRSFFSREI